MTLTEGMKYGDINVHSVKWVKYHVGNRQLTPHQLLERCPIRILGFSSSLGLKRKKKPRLLILTP